MPHTDSLQTPIRVRFAPSPTGHLHVGSLRTAIFNWLFARHYEGAFLIRIEDTDLERSKAEYTQAIKDALLWLDIAPDEPYQMQTEQLDTHKKVIQQLLEQKKAYKCYCTQQELAERFGDNAFIKYDRHCLNRDPEDKPYAIRFLLPEFESLSFDDLIRGKVTFDRDQLDDFIIARSDGSPVYNLVVVVDDIAMKISQVIRGEDHISNTPKQILLYQALEANPPQFAHIPLILGPSGDRLSKRDGATSAQEFQQLGYLPDALINYLVRLGWSHGDQEIFSRKELFNFFTLDNVGKKGAIFDREKLNWVNSVYIKQMSNQALLSYIIKYLAPTFLSKAPSFSKEQLLYAIGLYKERVHTITELISEVLLLANGPTEYSLHDMQEQREESKQLLQVIIERISSIEPFEKEACSAAIKAKVKELGVKFPMVAKPLRFALLGKAGGPGIYDMLVLLGKKESVHRLATFVNQL